MDEKLRNFLFSSVKIGYFNTKTGDNTLIENVLVVPTSGKIVKIKSTVYHPFCNLDINVLTQRSMENTL